MTRRLDFLEQALEEAEQAARWYAERSSAAAAAFLAELERALAAIEHAPASWPPFDHGTRRYLLKRFPYSVVYRCRDEKITVLAVAHAHRRPGYWRERTS